MKFKVTPQSIPDVLLIEPTVYADDRGYFKESYNLNDFEEFLPGVKFVQDNESKSTRGVLRGLHFQKAPHAQAKLVRVIQGSVWDVAVDIRPNSPTFKQYCLKVGESGRTSTATSQILPWMTRTSLAWA